MTERPFDFTEMVNGPDFKEDEGIDIMRNPRAFRESQSEFQNEPETLDAGRPDQELDKDEARRSYAVEQIIALADKGYHLGDPIAEAARLDRWLATGQESPGEGPGSRAEGEPLPQAQPTVDPGREAGKG